MRLRSSDLPEGDKYICWICGEVGDHWVMDCKERDNKKQSKEAKQRIREWAALKNINLVEEEYGNLYNNSKLRCSVWKKSK